MTKTLTTTAAFAALILLAAPVAEARDGQSSMRDIDKAMVQVKKDGGYGNPIIAVPTAIFEALDSAFDTVTGADDNAVAEGAPTRPRN